MSVRDVSADVVTVCGPSDSRSSVVQLFAVDEEPSVHGSRQTSDLLSATGHKCRPQLVVCHDDDDDDDEDDENDESDCDVVGPRLVVDLPLERPRGQSELHLHESTYCQPTVSETVQLSVMSEVLDRLVVRRRREVLVALATFRCRRSTTHHVTRLAARTEQRGPGDAESRAPS